MYKSKLYLAGKMRGCEHFNFPAFDGAKARLETEYHVVSPADIDRMFEDWPKGEMDHDFVLYGAHPSARNRQANHL